MDKIMKKVSKSEFYKFINGYQRKLERDVYGVCDPPVVTYNDFKLGNWPDSVVAKTWLYDDNPKGYYYCSEKDREYMICVNHDVDMSETRYK